MRLHNLERYELLRVWKITGFSTNIYLFKVNNRNTKKVWHTFKVKNKNSRTTLNRDASSVIHQHQFIYLFTHLFKVDNDKKDTVYKNTNKIAWG